MDPNECLHEAQENAKACLHDETMDCLENYVLWRERGGFQPDGGDLIAMRLMLEAYCTLQDA